MHEAGHIVIAWHLKIPTMWAEIRKIEPQDYTEKEWVGSVQPLVEGVEASKRMMVAVAGMVAEACWKREPFGELYDRLEMSPESMSLPDWEMSGCCPGEPTEEFWDATEHIFELLNRPCGRLWNSLSKQARLLIVNSRFGAAPSGDNEASGFAP
ncbi:hypothetical protein C7G41_33105 [Bradyrhizobium sp. MOS002]|nr:hypothetical protein C7G41_33105 [Bradyrhizobium sp. MOS002]